MLGRVGQSRRYQNFQSNMKSDTLLYIKQMSDGLLSHHKYYDDKAMPRLFCNKANGIRVDLGRTGQRNIEAWHLMTSNT